MEIPKGFKPNQSVEEKTKDLLEGKLKKIGDRIPRLIYAHLTLEELEKTKTIENSLTFVEIYFENDDYRYTLNFFPQHYGDCSMMQLEQTRGDSSDDIESIAVYISLYYEYTGMGKAFKGANSNRTITLYPPPPRFGLDEIIYGFKLLSEGERKFKGVRLFFVKFENVDSKALDEIELPESKLRWKTPGY